MPAQDLGAGIGVAGEDQQAATLDEQRCGVPGGDHVAADTDVDHVRPVFQRQCPERPAHEGQRVAVEGVGDHEVDAALFGTDPVEQGGHRLVVGVIDDHPDPRAATGRHLLGRVLHGSRQVAVAPPAGLPVGDVDGRVEASPRTSAVPRPMPRAAPVTTAIVLLSM